MTRCRACRRRLRAPSPDGLGPVCRRKWQARQPQPRTTALLALATETRSASPDQLPLYDEPEQP